MSNLPKNKDASRVSYNITDIPQLRHISKSVERSIQDVRKGMEGKRLVYPTKWARLNKNLMGGLQPQKMYVVAGRPGVGKSAFSNQLIFDVLDSNTDKEVIVFIGALRCRVNNRYCVLVVKIPRCRQLSYFLLRTNYLI